MGAPAWLPRYDVQEYHECVVALDPERVLQVALSTPVTPDFIVATLFGLRGFKPTTDTIGLFFTRDGFLNLAHTPTTYVFGMAARLRGKPSFATTVEEWRAWTPPGLRIAADFCVAPAGEGRTRLSTETRVFSLDPWTRRVFRLYWLLVGPFSAWIRRRWLKAIAARCGSAGLPLSLGFPSER